jgi:hypothetical protein
VLPCVPRASLSRISIFGAIIHARRELAACPFEAARRVIDVSGDGVNNSRPPPPNLDLYFQDRVLGGPGVFYIVAENFNSFG